MKSFVNHPARILVTSALPYANGPIHIGHLVEYIQTDIWVRFQKLSGRRCVYVCADDTHGTAIMISARKAGISEEAFIARVNEEHQRDFAGFQIQFDNYGSTNCPENRELCGIFWKKLRDAGLIKEKSINQLYDVTAGTFLADRFVKGTCPVCKSPNQYGDNCDKCTATYTPADLIDPVSTLSGTKPEIRSATHLFVELEKLHGFLHDWTQSGEHLQSEVANYLKGHFLGDELRDWDVSRPAPYFGFEIPDSPGNYWYVWFDAPIGYIASTWQWCKTHGEQLADWWQSADCEVHHFIGKDIQYFHTLFWPGMLKTAGYNLPEQVHIHGFLTVGGEKMSKSKGTFVRAATFLKHLDPAALRYYYASKLGPRLDDLDLNPDEFIDKVNSDLVGKVVNLASRTAKFVLEKGLSEKYPDDGGLFAQGAAAGAAIAEAYQNCDFARATRLIMELADRANPYIDTQAPWKLAKDPAKASDVRDVCTVGLNLFRQLVVYLTPILPKLAEEVGQLLNEPITGWEQSQQPLIGSKIQPYAHLFKRVEKKDFEAMIEEEKVAAAAIEAANAPASTAPAAAPQDTAAALEAEPLLTEQISIDDFTKVDLRVARVLEASEVPEAKKLLKLKLSMGGGVERQVFAGIKAAYKPEQLVGRLVIMVANLAPRQMKFGLSEGMVTACGPGGAEVFLLALDEGATPGMRVH
ncbi:methionine--tRNA ligase [Anatilimnocola floriformis]|uniref:methionine--tRNA ligase n=1 Tax=Anatilimnocola floriformis TaxID=2948575 RepID=UPI0036F37C8A